MEITIGQLIQPTGHDSWRVEIYSSDEHAWQRLRGPRGWRERERENHRRGISTCPFETRSECPVTRGRGMFQETERETETERERESCEFVPGTVFTCVTSGAFSKCLRRDARSRLKDRLSRLPKRTTLAETRREHVPTFANCRARSLRFSTFLREKPGADGLTRGYVNTFPWYRRLTRFSRRETTEAEALLTPSPTSLWVFREFVYRKPTRRCREKNVRDEVIGEVWRALRLRLSLARPMVYSLSSDICLFEIAFIQRSNV